MKRKIITISVTMMFFCLIAYPAIAEDIYNTEVKMQSYQIAWGNGKDDDGDGVIDNWGEPDVEKGTKEVDPDNTTSDTWFKNFTFPGPLEKGVAFDAYATEIMKIYSNENISVSPTDSCYYTNLTYVYENFSGYSTVDDVLNVATFYVNLSPMDVMNGAQEIWYRSPLVWNDPDNTYETHYLNIYNSDDELVYASPTDENANPKPKYANDDSALSGIGGQRVYYKLNFNFRTEEKYRFEEYVKTEDDNPINHVKLYMARAQDIGNDGLTKTYVFKGSEYGRKIPIESGWSAVCTVGIGRAGTEAVLFSNSSYDYATHRPKIYTHKFAGDPTVDDTGSATFIFPMRMTTPVNISISFRVWSGSSFQNWVSPADPDVQIIRNATGTLIFSLNIPDPDTDNPNYYQFSFTILGGFNSDGTDAVMYTMFPSTGSTHLVDDGFDNYEIKHFATHIEVANETTSTLGTETNQQTPDTVEFLIGLGLIIGGLILSVLVVTAPVSIPLMGAGASVAVLSFAVGTGLVAHSYTGEGILHFGDWLKDGIIRAGKGIVEGITTLAGGLWELILQIPEAVKWLGDAVMHWGGLILEAVSEIIWLLAFFGVIWIWSRFLEIMGYITQGNPEMAGKTARQTGSSIIKTTRKITRPLTKSKKSKTKKTKNSRWYKR